jgi:protein required for attachment to host cells
MTRDFSDRITWVAVADGEKAVILRNDDLDARPSLRLVEATEIDNPPSREQAVAPAGRNNDGRAGSMRKSAFDETDFHRLAKAEFARGFAAKLNRAAAAGAFDRLVVIAPPATLGELRAEYHADLKKRLVGEIDRDLTKHPIADIERQVAAALAKR